MSEVVALLARADWIELSRAHRARVEPLVAARLARRERGERHPVEDFLFEYYAYRPGQLQTWHPGFGVALQGAREYSGRRGYAACPEHPGAYTASMDGLRSALPRLRNALTVLESTADRAPELACFGRHEWAMVYRTEDIRHPDWPRRLTPAEIAAVVESAPLRCTHFDAFRFYSDAARPLNVVQPTRATQPALEQPACLHAGMDLYRWAFTLSPWVPSSLVLECFEHARRIRHLDMQVAPYDLRALGVEPVPIETAAGRAEFAARQRDFAAASTALRARLIETLRNLHAHTVTQGEPAATHV